MTTIPCVGTRTTITDAEGSEIGRAAADLDYDRGVVARRADLLAHLDDVASGEVNGWAQEACLREYDATMARRARIDHEEWMAHLDAQVRS